MLQPFEGVIAADSGHVNVHEAGAVEYTGHKVLSLAGKDGKIAAADLENYVARFYADDSYEHMVFPGMVYISFPTEYGTLYSKKELQEIYEVCKKRDLPLFVDGARLGYGLASSENDVTLEELAQLCDVFYIGGTKVGALCGEAVVFTNRRAPKYFVTQIKQHGALLAKGRLLGIQFDTLFTDDLYFCVCKKADQLAQKLRSAFEAKGYRMLVDSPTNQQFPIFPDTALEKLAEKYKYSYWARVDETHSAVRLCTSWATTDENVDALCKDIASVMAE